jgi:hypothetical protein
VRLSLKTRWLEKGHAAKLTDKIFTHNVDFRNNQKTDLCLDRLDNHQNAEKPNALTEETDPTFFENLHKS